MTIPTTSNKVIGQGNGAATNWPFTFIIPDAASLVVLYTDANGLITTIPSGQYSVAGLNDPNGGSVTYPLAGAPIAVGTSLTVLRTVAYNQQRSIRNQSGFFPDVYEAALDYLTMEVQQLAELIGRAIVAASTDVAPAMQLPPAAQRANTALGFDANGNVALLNKNSNVAVFSPSVLVIDTMAALKAMGVPAGAITCLVRGYAAIGDGGGGYYWWNAADVTPDDAGTVIQLNAGGNGRFNKLF